MNPLSHANSLDSTTSALLREALFDVWHRNGWSEILYIDDAGAYYCASAAAFSSFFLYNFLDSDPDALDDLRSLAFELSCADAVERYIMENATVLTTLDPWGFLHSVFATTPDGDVREYLNLDDTDDLRVSLVDWLTLAERSPNDIEPEWLHAYEMGIPLYDLAIGYEDRVLSWLDE